MRNLKIAAYILGASLSIILVYIIITYRGTTTLTINSTLWELKIWREQYMTVSENDWHLPADGRLDHTNSEIKSWERYISGYHYETIDDKMVEITEYSLRPVYATKYYYYIERWRSISPLITNGNDKELVAWPDTSMYDPNPTNNIGNIRLTLRTSHYWIEGIAANGKNYSLDLDEKRWRKYIRGTKHNLTLGFFGDVISLD